MAMICKNCNSVGPPKILRRGTLSLELLLWMCLLVPGFIYSAWRLMNKYKTCSSCGSSKVTDFEPSRPPETRRKSGSVEKQAKR
jgi:hypothetical protein